ncbi:hypothetical protein BGZ81_009839 [Podila clonocystis]|nr:hypothetical protein BGZ81_009839 [Podila clonocystis]
MDDARHLRRIFLKYRDLLATGSVYFIQYKNGFSQYPLKLPIKIGYTSKSVTERIAETPCEIYAEPLVVLPRPMDHVQTPPRPLAFAYLLEQILHAVFAHKQYDYRCPKDNTVHSEIFYFDPVYGTDSELTGGRSRIFDLYEQLDDWVEIVRDMEETHARIRLAYMPLKNQIKRTFANAGMNVNNTI